MKIDNSVIIFIISCITAFCTWLVISIYTIQADISLIDYKLDQNNRILQDIYENIDKIKKG